MDKYTDGDRVSTLKRLLCILCFKNSFYVSESRTPRLRYRYICHVVVSVDWCLKCSNDLIVRHKCEFSSTLAKF